jgi:hypothetical protein
MIEEVAGQAGAFAELMLCEQFPAGIPAER